MANVLVEESSLVAIAEGLRRAKGKAATKIVYVPTEVAVEAVKYSSTPNATGFGTYSGGYGNNQNLFDTVTLFGASKLQVKVQYQTESTSYDWLYIVPGEVTTMPSSGTQYGGSTTTTKTLTFDGNTVTFCFRSDGSNDSYLGYYAEITALDADGNVLEEGSTVTVDIPTEVPIKYRVCDMALASNERVYWVGTASSALELDFETSASGSLT